MIRHFFFILFFFIATHVFGESRDSSAVDSSLFPVATVSTFDNILYVQSMSEWKAPPESMFIEERLVQSQDLLFYFLVGMVLYLAFVKLLFPRYVYNMVTLFFQANFRRKQTAEQLQQDVFPALLLNIFYIIVLSAFITQVAVLQGWTNLSFWSFGFYCMLILTSISVVKYIFIRVAGLLSGLSGIAETYLFIVFLINKLASIFLLILLMLLSFCDQSWIEILLLVTIVFIGVTFLFRYLLSYNVLHKNLRVNPLQFFIYLCVVEFLPFLIFYEVLFNKFGYNF